jgi:DNA-binding NtrC family response regulator
MAHVLVIDDDRQFRDTLRTALERAGHRVITAVDGRNGVEQYRRFRPDVVVTDLVMPEADGAEALQAMRETNPLAKVIVTSGRAYSDVMLRMAKQLGADAVFAKPFPHADLIAAVERCAADAAEAAAAAQPPVIRR